MMRVLCAARFASRGSRGVFCEGKSKTGMGLWHEMDGSTGRSQSGDGVMKEGGVLK